MERGQLSKVSILKPSCDTKSFIKELTKSGLQDDAFYVCDIGDFVRKHDMWKTLLPRVKPHYAVKCNDSTIVLENLATLGLGFDCASKHEIDKVMSLGVHPDRIIFANPVKPLSHIKHAQRVGVEIMTFDNLLELEKVRKYYKKAKLVIRIKCDAEDAQCLFGMKFGCDAETEAPELLRKAKSLNLNVIGVSFHVGSGCKELKAYSRAIKLAKKVFTCASTIGYSFKLLDLGGGYPGDYGSDFGKIARYINTSLEEHFDDLSIQVVAEPGRFYVHTAYTLACNIHSTKDIKLTNPTSGVVELHRMYYINDGVYGSFNSKVSYNEIYVPHGFITNTPGSKLMSCSIWGPTCDSLDRVVEHVWLPEMNIGDWLIFEEMGAYTLSIATQFNGFPIPKVFMVADKSMWSLLNEKGLIIKNNCTGYPTNKEKMLQKLWFNKIVCPFRKSVSAFLDVISSFQSYSHILEL